MYSVLVARKLAISIHAPREGSDDVGQMSSVAYYISIHAPREGSDSFNFCNCCTTSISIHAPREGSDLPPPVKLDL